MMASDAEKFKRKFRTSKAWRTFRHNIHVRDGGRDFITGTKLLKGYECHHLDLDVEHYKNLDEENFVSLNKMTHKVVHWLYPRFVKDSKIIDRLVEVLEKMKKINKE